MAVAIERIDFIRVIGCLFSDYGAGSATALAGRSDRQCSEKLSKELASGSLVALALAKAGGVGGDALRKGNGG